jgi:hypothetical protein
VRPNPWCRINNAQLLLPVEAKSSAAGLLGIQRVATLLK